MSIGESLKTKIAEFTQAVLDPDRVLYAQQIERDFRLLFRRSRRQKEPAQCRSEGMVEGCKYFPGLGHSVTAIRPRFACHLFPSFGFFSDNSCGDGGHVTF